jgi:purine-binding chemotaxis protein CheW
MDTVVVFKIDDRRMAVPVNRVQRVIWAVEITALPVQASTMLGIINVEGAIIPVVNARNLLGVVDRELDLDDHIVIVSIDGECVAFIVDSVEGVMHYKDEDFSALPDKDGDCAKGVIKQDGELIVILDPVKLLKQTASFTGSQHSLAGSAR